jgi:Protein of unknown function (DUF2865)
MIGDNERVTTPEAILPLLGSGRAGWRFAVVACLLALSAVPAAAQSSWWPFSNSEPPRPPAPVYRTPPAPIPPAATLPQPLQPQGGRNNGGGPICVQLEQRLVAEGQRGNQGRNQGPKLDDEIRQTERLTGQAQSQLERGDCFEYFLFSKTLRRTPQCVQAAGQLDAAKRRLSELSILRQQAEASSGNSYQDDIIRELARNGCGAQYVQEARKRDGGSIFGGSEDDSPRGENNFGSLPFATYRTVCVRLCDGFFFPVSFSTLPNHFGRDVEQCQSRCAAPVELYYHQNPGADIRQAVSVKSQTPYTNLKSAFKYTKEYINGCSCKEAEYVPAAGDKKAEAPSGTTVAGPAVRAATRVP